jgi:hypothetical protein
MTQFSHEASASRLPTFEEAYPRYEFSELVRLSIFAAEWLGGHLNRCNRRHATRARTARVPAPRSDRIKFQVLLLVAAFLVPAEIAAGERKPGISAALTIDGANAASWPLPSLVTAARRGPPLFFGYVEFDIDPDAPDGVPGFGPLPDPTARASR